MLDLELLHTVGPLYPGSQRGWRVLRGEIVHLLAGPNRYTGAAWKERGLIWKIHHKPKSFRIPRTHTSPQKRCIGLVWNVGRVLKSQQRIDHRIFNFFPALPDDDKSLLPERKLHLTIPFSLAGSSALAHFFLLLTKKKRPSFPFSNFPLSVSQSKKKCFRQVPPFNRNKKSIRPSFFLSSLGL